MILSGTFFMMLKMIKSCRARFVLLIFCIPILSNAQYKGFNPIGSPDDSSTDNADINLFRGTPNISVPIYTIQASDLTIPVSLSYNAKGVKVAEIASWVGLNWNLNAGGVITREVKGMPDDIYKVERWDEDDEEWQEHTNVGYLWDANYSQTLHSQAPENYSDDIKEHIKKGTKDDAPDVFHFNFLGASGSFVFRPNGSKKAEFFNNQGYKLEYELTNTLATPPAEIHSEEKINGRSM